MKLGNNTQAEALQSSNLQTQTQIHTHSHMTTHVLIALSQTNNAQQCTHRWKNLIYSLSISKKILLLCVRAD